MKLELYETSSKRIRELMSNPPGEDQHALTMSLIELRITLDKKISELVAQRREFQIEIEKKCSHPVEKRALKTLYFDDTLGNSLFSEEIVICRDCGQNLLIYREQNRRVETILPK